jgi:hypothetical protein
MLKRHCTQGRGLFLAALMATSIVAPQAEAQSVTAGYSLALSRFGGDATLPNDLGFLCFWDDGIWTLTDYLDVGYFVSVGKKTYLIGGVEGEEVLSMVFKKRKGDLVLGSPVNSTELVGQDVIIVAAAKLKPTIAGCVARQTNSGKSLLSEATFGERAAPRNAR